MFDNGEDVDVDDEFLNVVFENEERSDNNTFLRTGNLCPGAATSIELKTPSAIRECVKNCKDPSDTYEHFHARHDISSSCSGRLTPSLKHAFAEQSGANRDPTSGINSVGDKENKRKRSPPPSRSKRERKFPGPAGLLPDRKCSRGTPLKLDNLLEVESPSASNTDELCSQGRLSGSVLEEGPWQSLVTDLGQNAEVLDVVNVASVKRKAAARCFTGRKVPFLAAVLYHLDVSSADPCIILRDSTGEIHGTLHREVWQQFAAELVVGSVLVITNVGLLSTGISSRRHYLNITANNLATIYSANPEKPQKRELHSLTAQDYVRTIEHWRSLVAPPRTTGSPASSLFNTSLPSSSPTMSPQVKNLGSRHPSIPPTSNTRPTTSQDSQGCGKLPATPQYPRAVHPPRPMGKKLFPLCTNSNPVSALNSSLHINAPSASKPPGSIVNQRNPGFGRNMFNNSVLTHSEPKTITINSQRMPMTRTPDPNSFKFDPVMLKTKTVNGAVYPQNNLEKQSTSMNEWRRDVNSLGNNSPKIILSQSSQLTVEEQSVVESVFDGIDADSLFDDDF